MQLESMSEVFLWVFYLPANSRVSPAGLDVSADLTELGRTPITVVSAGVKSILDIGRTLEYLVRNISSLFCHSCGFISQKSRLMSWILYWISWSTKQWWSHNILTSWFAQWRLRAATPEDAEDVQLASSFRWTCSAKFWCFTVKWY